jgi:hypothetical protein
MFPQTKFAVIGMLCDKGVRIESLRVYNRKYDRVQFSERADVIMVNGCERKPRWRSSRRLVAVPFVSRVGTGVVLCCSLTHDRSDKEECSGPKW